MKYKIEFLIFILICLISISSFDFKNLSYAMSWDYEENGNIPAFVDGEGGYIPNVHINDNMILVDVYRTWAQEAITYCAMQGYLNDMLSRKYFYNPDSWSDKSELAVMLGRTQEIDYTKYTKDIFTDISINDDYYDVPMLKITPYYVNWAGTVGILKGNNSGALDYIDPLTREQAAVIIDRYIEIYTNLYDSKGSGYDISFKDWDQTSDWAKDSVKRLSGVSLMNGDENGFFNPKKEINRSEICQIIFNLAQREIGNMKIDFKQTSSLIVIPELIYE